MIWSLYVIGIVLAIVMGVVFKKTLFRGEAPLFIMELPPYQMPSFRSLCLHTWEKGKHFLVKAGTYILAVSVFVWFLLNLPWGVESKKDSYLGKAGQVVAPALAPLGFGTWEAASSLITGVIAKEIVVGTMGEIYAPKKEEKKETPTLGEDLREIDLWENAGTYLASKEEAIERAGAGLLICVSNTMRRVVDTFTCRLTIPFIHIVDPTGAAVRAAGLRRVGLLGTKPVMSGEYLKRRYTERIALELVVPSEEEQVAVDRIIFDELVRRDLKTASKSVCLEIVHTPSVGSLQEEGPAISLDARRHHPLG